MAKLRETITELEAILADDAKLRGVIDDRDDGDPGRVRRRRAAASSPTTPATWASRT